MVTGDEAVVCDLTEMRHIEAADFIGIGTARMEDAAFRQIKGARYFAADYGPALVMRVRPGYRGDEHLRIGMERVVKDSVARSQFDEAP